MRGGSPGGSSIHTGLILAKNARYLVYKIICRALLFQAYIIDKIENKNIEKLGIGIFYNISGKISEIFKNFLEAESKFARLRLQGLKNGLASGGASRLRLHIPA